MILEIATIRIKLTFDYDYHLDSDYINRIFTMYKAQDTDGTFDFELKLIEKTALPSRMHTMESRNEALYYENEDTFIFETESWAATIHWSQKVMTTMFYDINSTDILERLFMRSLKLLTSLLVLEKGGLPFHCSAVMDKENMGILFSGQSTAGKTTTALSLHLKENLPIFNDEFNILMPENNIFHVFSTPFTTAEKFIYCSFGCAPVKSLYFIKKSTCTKTEEIILKQRYFSVLGGIYSFPTSEKFSTIIMHTAEKAARTIPMKMLYINHESSDPYQIMKLIQ